MTARVTIKVEPKQHISPGSKKVNVKANYEGGAARPNDLHLYYRRLSAFNGDWIKIVDITVGAAPMPLPFPYTFEKPDDPGTYDIRAVFTLNGKPLPDGDRTAQFFVD
jgi:hypothetical protein